LRAAQDAEGKYEVLAKYARDLTEEARAGKLVRAQNYTSRLHTHTDLRGAHVFFCARWHRA
jgi:hypothetical protein